jgi:hypothetical protein
MMNGKFLTNLLPCRQKTVATIITRKCGKTETSDSGAGHLLTWAGEQIREILPRKTTSSSGIRIKK